MARAKMTRAEFRKKLSGWRARVHIHPSPTCSGSTHDTSCAGKGREVVCTEISVSGIKACACVHLSKA